MATCGRDMTSRLLPLKSLAAAARAGTAAGAVLLLKPSWAPEACEKHACTFQMKRCSSPGHEQSALLSPDFCMTPPQTSTAKQDLCGVIDSNGR